MQDNNEYLDKIRKLENENYVAMENMRSIFTEGQKQQAQYGGSGLIFQMLSVCMLWA